MNKEMAIGLSSLNEVKLIDLVSDWTEVYRKKKNQDYLLDYYFSGREKGMISLSLTHYFILHKGLQCWRLSQCAQPDPGSGTQSRFPL